MSKMVAKVIKSSTIKKTDNSEQIDCANDIGDWISNPNGTGFQLSLRKNVEESNIIPQCIRAYMSNIVGFGIGQRYKDEFQDAEETQEMKTEWGLLQKQINKLNIRRPYKSVFGEFVENRETFGIAYLEVIRDVKGNIAYVENIKDVPSIAKSKELDPIISSSVYVDGVEIKIPRKFRKYRQSVNGKDVYFKEFGDSRNMDMRSGTYSDSVPKRYRANEIIEVKIGIHDYGLPRWYGQLLGVDGSRRAENLNRNYFIKGRHIPLAFAIEGGTLTEESENAIRDYINGIEGENGQHSFLLLETEVKEEEVASVNYGDNKQVMPKIEIKDLAPMLQKDELFQEYIDNVRKRVQSAFNLPDVYVGYTTEYNRATVLAAMEVTEQQVFAPERNSLDWVLNHQLFAELNLKYCEAYFKAPELNNVDDIVNLLGVANAAGGVTPNKVRAILYEYLGETAEAFPEEWGDVPMAVYLANLSQNSLIETGNLEKSIKKAELSDDEETLVVLKSLKNVVNMLSQKVNPSE